jgi:hypothetical protein
MGVPVRVNLFRLQQIRGMGGNSWRMSHNREGGGGEGRGCARAPLSDALSPSPRSHRQLAPQRPSPSATRSA